MQALLIVNPAATTTAPRMRDVLEHALASDLKLEVVATTHRGHAHELAERSARDGMDVVVVLGGDGTVNEVVNGLLHSGPTPHQPAVAIVPGGSTNVFARCLGVPRDQVEATGQLLDALREGRRRAVSLGMADDRWFTFAAGLGLDADVVASVERHRSRGRTSTPSLYLRSAMWRFLAHTNRRQPTLAVRQSGQEPIEGLYMTVVSNTTPWTFLGSRPVTVSPDASVDSGLDLYALRGLGVLSTANQIRQLLLHAEGQRRGRNVVSLHDVPSLTVTASKPAAFQVDGDYIGTRGTVTFTSVPRALTVIV
jgi:diacylglycerol kinase family enzyme